MGLPTKHRIRKGYEFDGVRARGERLVCGPFILQCLNRGDGGVRRLGLVVSRKVGNAVVRSYGKRVIRELFREHMGVLPEGVDLVVVLRWGYREYRYAALEAEFIRGCEKVGGRVG